MRKIKASASTFLVICTITFCSIASVWSMNQGGGAGAPGSSSEYKKKRQSRPSPSSVGGGTVHNHPRPKNKPAQTSSEKPLPQRERNLLETARGTFKMGASLNYSRKVVLRPPKGN